jgi:hypothetical protein
MFVLLFRRIHETATPQFVDGGIEENVDEAATQN